MHLGPHLLASQRGINFTAPFVRASVVALRSHSCATNLPLFGAHPASSHVLVAASKLGQSMTRRANSAGGSLTAGLRGKCSACTRKFLLRWSDDAERWQAGLFLLALSCSLALSARHLVRALGTVYEAPTFSQWTPAFSQSHALLALTTGRPRSASGSRPSRFCCSLALSARHPMLDNCMAN